MLIDFGCLLLGYAVHMLSTIAIRRRYKRGFGLRAYVGENPYAFALSLLSLVVIYILALSDWFETFFPVDVGRSAVMVIGGYLNSSLLKKVLHKFSPESERRKGEKSAE